MDVVLFHPAAQSGWHPYRRRQLPLSLLSVASPLDREGYRIAIIDQWSDRHWKRKLEEALSERPICFGVTSMTGPQIGQALKICKYIKTKYPDLPVVWGGIHVSALPEQSLENPYVDIAVVGEGEDTFIELVRALENGTPLERVTGVGYRENGQYVFTGRRPFVDLNAQPLQAYHLVDMNLYSESILGVDHIHIQCSRGCTFNCAFCWDPVFHKKRSRTMDPKRVLETMARLNTDYGFRGFALNDDNFLINSNWAYEVLEEIARSDLNIVVGKLHIRADTICKLDHEFMTLMGRIGVKRVAVGVESGSRRILELVKKGITPEQVIEANRKLLSYSIQASYLFMMGLPTEKPEEIFESIRLADKLTSENPSATRSFNIYTPYPGTELFKLTVDLGMKVPQRLEDWIPFTYRYIPKESPWILPETRKLISILDFALMTDAHDTSLGSLRNPDPISTGLAKAYAPLAHYRMKNMDFRFPVETKVIKALRWAMGRE